MSLDLYLQETRYALEQLIGNLKFYKSLCAELAEAVHQHKSFVFDEEYNSDPDNPDYEAELDRYRSETVETSQRLRDAISRLKGAAVSQNAIAGAIIQIAFMGIKLHSSNETVPSGWEGVGSRLRPGLAHQLKCFGVGRLVWGEVPLGLVVYAARNQYHHHDEAPSNALVKEVLGRIRDYRRESLTFKDVPPFDADPRVVASHLLRLVGWDSFAQLQRDLTEAVAADQLHDTVTERKQPGRRHGR
jgi:hypothetical protein